MLVASYRTLLGRRDGGVDTLGKGAHKSWRQMAEVKGNVCDIQKIPSL